MTLGSGEKGEEWGEVRRMGRSEEEEKEERWRGKGVGIVRKFEGLD